MLPLPPFPIAREPVKAPAAVHDHWVMPLTLWPNGAPAFAMPASQPSRAPSSSSPNFRRLPPAYPSPTAPRAGLRVSPPAAASAAAGSPRAQDRPAETTPRSRKRPSESDIERPQSASKPRALTVEVAQTRHYSVGVRSNGTTFYTHVDVRGDEDILAALWKQNQRYAATHALRRFCVQFPSEDQNESFVREFIEGLRALLLEGGEDADNSPAFLVRVRSSQTIDDFLELLAPIEDVRKENMVISVQLASTLQTAQLSQCVPYTHLSRGCSSSSHPSPQSDYQDTEEARETYYPNERTRGDSPALSVDSLRLLS
jgi:hypothetical protein